MVQITNTEKDNILIQRTDFKVGQTLEELKLDMTDDELKTQIKAWIGMSANTERVLKTNGDINKNYYKGIDNRTNDITDDKSKVTDNRIFTDLETIIPIVTSTPAKPIVFIPSAQGKGKKGKNIRDMAIKNQKVLLAIYADQKLQAKFEKMVRQHQIFHIGMVKYGIADGKIFADVKLPSRLLLDSEATTVEDSEFVGEKIVDTARNLIKKFPTKKSDIETEVSGKLGTKLTYIEWWTDDMMVTSIDSRVILDAKKNPLFDYEGVTKTTYDDMGKEIQETTKNNIFNSPKKPFIRFSVYSIGENILDDTTVLELSKSLQDNINDRKRQIADNSELVGNAIRAYKGLTQEQADDANANLRAGDGVNLGDDQDIAYIQAAGLPAYVQNDLQDSRNAVDNIFGIHDTSKGVRQGGAGESGDAREQLREGDQDRQATIGRALEEVSEELYNAFAHLIKVFYDKPQLIPILGKPGAEDMIEFKRDDIADGMVVRVRPGSTIPEDPNAVKAQSLELAGMGKITNRRLFEALGLEDADEAVKELELEGVKAQQEQQEVIAKEQKEEANTQATTGFEEQIAQIGAGQPE